MRACMGESEEREVEGRESLKEGKRVGGCGCGDVCEGVCCVCCVCVCSVGLS